MLKHYAGRNVVGSLYNSIVGVNGMRVKVQCGITGRVKEVYNLGGANAFLFQNQHLEDLKHMVCPSEALHTSIAIRREQIEGFIKEIKHHLPSSFHDDMIVNFQTEGASAVNAAVDLLMQIRGTGKVAVGSRSYHGPQNSSFGSGATNMAQQIIFPLALPSLRLGYETNSQFEARMRKMITDWFQRHGDSVAVLLLEPVGGTQLQAYTQPMSILHHIFSLAKSYDIAVVCDEVFVAFRSSQESFVSISQGLLPDAITFGKGLSGGMGFPLSCAVLQKGANFCSDQNITAMESHTYAGADSNALALATASLKKIRSSEVRHNMRQIEMVLDAHIFEFPEILKWNRNKDSILIGATFCAYNNTHRLEIRTRFARACNEMGIITYPTQNGFILCIALDADITDLRVALQRLTSVIATL